MKKKLFQTVLLSAMLAIGFIGHAQSPTVGLLFHNPKASEGYTLFSPDFSHSVYLVDNCGEKINEWIFSEPPALTCYLLDNGTLLRAGSDSLEIRDWDNNLLWSYPTTANGIRQHHDIHPLPNGNILCLVRDIYLKAEIIAAGRDPSNLLPKFWLDKLIEISPVGTHEAHIVWEWKFFDHLIQDFDSTKLNYGVVKDHPELLDLNFQNNYPQDYTHVNAVCFNAALDQIIITSRHLSELYIIDHSTTTLEAAGHSGGNSGMGGDFLWRWGNPQVYREGRAHDQKTFQPHDAKWVEPGYLDEGKISVFNNEGDGTGTFSSVHLITPSFENGAYRKENNVFAPLDFEWTWSGSILGEVVFEENKSGAHSMPNGNFIITQTSLGQISEVTKNWEHLWTYKSPVGWNRVYTQYSHIYESDNAFFRGEKYPETYPGFIGLDLTPKGLIEDQNSLSDSCRTVTGIIKSDVEVISIENPVENNNIRFNQPIRFNAMTITDINGRELFRHGFFHGNNLEVDLKPALYILRLYFDDRVETRKILVR